MSTTTQTLLYKMDSRNKIREWCIWTELNKVIIRHGETNASKTFETITCDSIDDAIVQADRRIAKQKDRRGYTTHIPITKPLLPMLANPNWTDIAVLVPSTGCGHEPIVLCLSSHKSRKP